MKDRICKYCRKPYTPRKGDNRGYACYRPDCQAENRKQVLQRQRENAAAWRARGGLRANETKTARRCVFCNEPLPEGRYFYHKDCYRTHDTLEQMPRSDGDYAYA